MAEITLPAEAQRPVGSSASRRLRHQNRIPAIVYGRGIEPLAVSVDGRDLRSALSGEAGLNALLSLEVDGRQYLAMARELQRHPVRGTVTHVDFQVVDREQMMAADVPVSTVGDAVAVAHADGIVDQQLFALPVKAKPADIPPGIEVDISALTVGGAVRIADLQLPPGVTTDLDLDTVVVIGVPPRISRAEAAAAEGAEGEEGAGAAAGEGAPTPASSDS